MFFPLNKVFDIIMLPKCLLDFLNLVMHGQGTEGKLARALGCFHDSRVELVWKFANFVVFHYHISS